MRIEGVMDVVWTTLWCAALVGVSGAWLPNTPAFQLVFVPAWITYWLATRGAGAGRWIAFWGGALLESAWDVPPGACILFFLLIGELFRLYREALSETSMAGYGLLVGVVLAPALALWLWLYACLFPGFDASALAPHFPSFLILPATGALGGAVVFALARGADFRVLRPPQEETLNRAR